MYTASVLCTARVTMYMLVQMFPYCINSELNFIAGVHFTACVLFTAIVDYVQLMCNVHCIAILLCTAHGTVHFMYRTEFKLAGQAVQYKYILY